MDKAIYFGLDPQRYKTSKQLIHFPLIETVAYEGKSIECAIKNWEIYTHVLFTSRTAVSLLLSHLQSKHFDKAPFEKKTVISIGRATASLIPAPSLLPKCSTAEGLCQLLENLIISKDSHLFFPHSALSRPILFNYFSNQLYKITNCVLYTTRTRKIDQLIDLEDFEELIFTSPSTVHAFIELYGSFPVNKKLTAIGLITRNIMTKFQKMPIVNASCLQEELKNG